VRRVVWAPGRAFRSWPPGSRGCLRILCALTRYGSTGEGRIIKRSVGALMRSPNGFRGRVFATEESTVWSTMMVSMMFAGIASQYYDRRSIGAVAGVLSSTTAIFWGWAHWTGRLPEPALEGIDPEDVEVHGEPTI
jgi:hypothetical protein